MCIQHLQLWFKISSDLCVHGGVGLEREREGREDCRWQNSERGGRDKKWLGPLVAEVMVYAAWPRVIYPCSPFLAVSRSLSLFIFSSIPLPPTPSLHRGHKNSAAPGSPPDCTSGPRQPRDAHSLSHTHRCTAHETCRDFVLFCF